MQRKHGELLPAAEVLSGLDGPVKAIRDASPQARHHFTQADQVNQLVRASEADADLGFMARMMALCSLPRTNPGDRIRYKRVNGPYTLYITALERRLRETETRLERFSRETDKAVENLRTLRQTLDGEEAASKSRSEQIRDSHRIPLQMHGWFLPVALVALFFGLLGSFVRAWGEWLVDVIYG